jgi:hypothetical protein
LKFKEYGYSQGDDSTGKDEGEVKSIRSNIIKPRSRTAVGF